MARVGSREETPGRRRDLALAWAVGFTMWGLLLAVDAVLETVQAELNLNYTLRSLVLALPFLSMAVSAIPGGFLADRWGVHRSVALGGGIATVGGGLRAVPVNAVGLLAAAGIFGVGLGLVIPNLPKFVGTRYGPGSGGIATGIYSTGLIAGSVCGVYLTGPLALMAGSWRSALGLWAAFAAGAMVSWTLLLHSERSPAQAVRGGYASLLRRRDLWILSFIFAAGNASYFFLVGAYPQYLVTRGFLVDEAFGQLAVLIAVGVPGIFLVPILSDRVKRRRPFLWGPHALIATLLFLVPAVTQDAVPLVSLALGFAEMAIFALGLLLPVDLFSPDEVGRASGIVISIAYVGALLGPLVSGVALDLTQSFGGVLIAFGLLSIVTAAVVFALPEAGRAESEGRP